MDLPVILLTSLLLPAAVAAGRSDLLVFFGTYTGNGSRGIYSARLEPSGKLGPLTLAAETPNPSFLAIAPNQKFLYAVNEQRSGEVSAFSIDPASGKLTFLNQMPTRGSGPCYVAVDRRGRDVLVANYNSGSVAVLPIASDGRLKEASAFDQHTGSSVNPQRQKGPHAHCFLTAPGDRFALSADLGLDKVLVYRFDPAKVSLQPNEPPFATVPPGSGPRHIAFGAGAKFVYVVSEMGSTVTAFAWNARGGVLKSLETLSTLPKDFSGQSTGAEVAVHPNGRFLYASNRGDNSIALFAIDRTKGTLKPIDHTSTQGKTPRNFAIDPSGHFLIAANQDSDNLVLFRIDARTGRLTPTGQNVELSRPVCVVFMGSK